MLTSIALFLVLFCFYAESFVPLARNQLPLSSKSLSGLQGLPSLPVAGRRAPSVSQHAAAFSFAGRTNNALASQWSKAKSLLPIGVRRLARPLLPLLGAIFLCARTALATASAAVPKRHVGWDLYGRVPYDDWLFKTDRLLDPNLLKRSFVEAVVEEIPDALGAFNRKKMIVDTIANFKGVTIVAAVILALGLFAKNRWDIRRETRLRDAKIRGFDTPISAVYKGRSYTGKKISSEPEWILMDKDENLLENEVNESDDEDSDDDESSSDDEEGKKKNGKNGKGK